MYRYIHIYIVYIYLYVYCIGNNSFWWSESVLNWIADKITVPRNTLTISDTACNLQSN